MTRNRLSGFPTSHIMVKCSCFFLVITHISLAGYSFSSYWHWVGWFFIFSLVSFSAFSGSVSTLFFLPLLSPKLFFIFFEQEHFLNLFLLLPVYFFWKLELAHLLTTEAIPLYFGSSSLDFHSTEVEILIVSRLLLTTRLYVPGLAYFPTIPS